MARPAQDEATRFAKFVQKTDGCHLWQSTLHRTGYGRFYFRGRQAPAHVVAYILTHGSVPEGKIVCHTCDVRNCVNPEHLYAGDHFTNARDRVARHRHVGRRKLTDMGVRVIRRLLEQSSLSQEQIAEPFGIKQVAVSRVKLGQHDYLSRVAA
jgi:hypothetical protein